MSLLNLAVIFAVAAAVAAIPRRTRKAAILASSLAALASLTAVVYASARVEKPALGGNGPLALAVPTDVTAPDYHQPLETWRVEHPAYVQASAAGEAECLTCHDDPDAFCNQCHSYAGVRLVAAPPPIAEPPVAEAGGEAVSAPTFSGDVWPLLYRKCAACHGTKGGLSVASVADLLRGGVSGPAIAPGDAERSLLIQSLRGTLEEGERMPPGRKP